MTASFSTGTVDDLPCRRGHSTLRTMPQIVRAMRSTPGDWVSLAG